MQMACGAANVLRYSCRVTRETLGTLHDIAQAARNRPTKTKRHGSDSVAFCFVVLLVRQTSVVCLHRFASQRTFATLTGLRPMPERLPMQQRPKRQRLRPKQQS
jgi:hypothetical protein